MQLSHELIIYIYMSVYLFVCLSVFLSVCIHFMSPPFRIVTPILPHNGPACVRFAYHMYGNRMGSLTLFTQERYSVNTRQVWFKNGDLQNIWWNQEVDVDLTNSGTMVLVFTH